MKARDDNLFKIERVNLKCEKRMTQLFCDDFWRGGVEGVFGNMEGGSGL